LWTLLSHGAMLSRPRLLWVFLQWASGASERFSGGDVSAIAERAFVHRILPAHLHVTMFSFAQLLALTNAGCFFVCCHRRRSVVWFGQSRFPCPRQG
jgi:hypothetical protein